MAKTNDFCYVVIETWYEEPTHDIHVVGTFRTDDAALKYVNKAIAEYIAEAGEVDEDDEARVESEEAYEISNYVVKGEGVVYEAHSVSEVNEMPQSIVIHKQRLRG